MNRNRLPVFVALFAASIVLFGGIAGAEPAKVDMVSAPTLDACQPAPAPSMSGTPSPLVLPDQAPAWLPQAPIGTGCSAAFCAGCAANGEMCVNARICICI